MMSELTQACQAFEKLLGEQLTRIANMNTEKTDFTTKKTVAVDDAGVDALLGGKIRFFFLHTGYPVHLFFQQLQKGAACLGRFKHYSPPSLV